VNPPQPTATPGEDPASTVSEFWNSFEELFGRKSDQVAESGGPALTWKEIADKFDIKERTLSDWRNKRILPSNSASLIKVAVYLGGHERDWRTLWRDAHAAHQGALAASRQSLAEPDGTADRVQAKAPEQQLEDTGEPAVPEMTSSYLAVNGTRTGKGRPARRPFSRRVRLAALTVAIAAAILTIAAVVAERSSDAPVFTNGQCRDWAVERAPVHSAPVSGDETGYIVNAGQMVTGSCQYFIDNNGDSGSGHWFMQVTYSGPNDNLGYGYIWIQQLAYGSSHSCDRDGYNGSSGYHSYDINSGACQLIPLSQGGRSAHRFRSRASVPGGPRRRQCRIRPHSRSADDVLAGGKRLLLGGEILICRLGGLACGEM
jgi:hypothetical protein